MTILSKKIKIERSFICALFGINELCEEETSQVTTYKLTILFYNFGNIFVMKTKKKKKNYVHMR
jgi:hypothetical protein